MAPRELVVTRTDSPSSEVSIDDLVHRERESEPRGLLHTEINCPQGMEAEFHAWYNTEHLLERRSIPGFVTARRYVALEGEPRWLALYELESQSVLHSPEYRRQAGPITTGWTTGTSWTKRVTSHSRELRRTECDLGWSQRARGGFAGGPTEAPGLLTVRYGGPPGIVDAVNARHDGEYAPSLLEVPGLLSARRYRCVEHGTEYLALYELTNPWIVQTTEFAIRWAKGWEQVRPVLSTWRRRLYLRIA